MHVRVGVDSTETEWAWRAAETEERYSRVVRYPLLCYGDMQAVKLGRSMGVRVGVAICGTDLRCVRS